LNTYAIVAQDVEQTATGTGGGGGGMGGNTGFFIMVAVMIAIMYLLLFRPQQKREKERQRKREDMLKSLKKSDHIVTIGGIHGIVASVGEDEVTVKIDERGDVRIRVSRDAIGKVVGEDEEKDAEKKLGDTSGERR